MQSSAAQDLAYIREIMDESRSFANVAGDYYILWGVATGAALLGNFAFALGWLPLPPFYIWAICIAAGWAGTALLARRDRARNLVSHPSGRLIMLAWVGVGIAMSIALFAGSWNGSIRPLAIPGFAAAFIGLGVGLNGAIARIDWLRNLAFIWWAAALPMLLWPGNYTLVVFAVLVIALYVVPGIKLNAMARRLRGAA
jgi:hypothetical protein